MSSIRFFNITKSHERWNIRTLRERINSKYEKQEGEEEPIAIILCASKDSEVVELMDLSRDNIHVSEYWLQLPPKELLEEKLSKAIERTKLIDAIKKP